MVVLMINKIIDIALGNRAVILVLIAALIVAGLLSIQRLPFDADPDISPLQVLVTTQAPGLAPQDVERSITTPIELALQGLPSMTSYRSISRYGLSVIYVKFADGGDILTARALVAQRLSQTALPTGAGTPLLGPLSDGLSEIYLHPATGPFPGDAPGYHYREEFDALMAAEVVAASRDSSLRLGGFSDFLDPETTVHPAASYGSVPNRNLMP